MPYSKDIPALPVHDDARVAAIMASHHAAGNFVGHGMHANDLADAKNEERVLKHVKGS